MSPLVLPLLLILPGADSADLSVKAVEKINAYRTIVGLPRVRVDAALSEACAAHAKYLMTNRAAAFQQKINVHDEDANLPGYSDAGRRAAKSSVIAQASGGEPLVGLDAWIASFFHRISLLDPNLVRVGVAVERNGPDWAFVLDTLTGKDRPERGVTTVVCYPVNTQMGVPRLFSLGAPEVPNPIPNNGDSRKAGHPITVTFFQETAARIEDVTATLIDPDGKDVPLWVSWPERPAVKNYGRNTICLIPQAPLTADVTYEVRVKATVNGREWQKQWHFHTGMR